MIFDWLERRIDPFAAFDEGETPPNTVGRFAWHYLRPVRGWLGVLFVVSLAVGVLESSLYIVMGWFVDLLAKSSPDRLLAEHGMALAGVAALILLPLFLWGAIALKRLYRETNLAVPAD
jgi:ATP-binding cassette subfamily B multidrug efflux pump